MPIYSEGTQPYQAPLSSPVGLEPYGEILALRKMMENGESALHDAEQAAATVGSAVTAANQAASGANSAASSARSAAAVASEKASAADTAATQASSAASDANFNAAWARSEANNARTAAQSASSAATAAGSAASNARQAATAATQAATAANQAVTAAQAATGQASDALAAANAANATATASIALAESAASDASTAAADARSATANAVTATSNANVATANANAAADSANRAANVAAAAANNANAKAADARRAADLANAATTAANRATSDASGAADDASAAATAANSAATAASSAATAANSAATSATQAATAASSAATTATDAAATAASSATTANAAAGNANAAANRVDTAISDANAAASSASAAATDAEDRIEAAIEAAGDISELAVPLMSADTRGGAKLGDGLAVDDGTLHVGQLAKASTGEVHGPLASVTAKGHAEQASTTGKNLLPNTATSQTINGVTFAVNADGSIDIGGTYSSYTHKLITNNFTLGAGTYTVSGCPVGGGYDSCIIRVETTNNDAISVDAGSSSTFTLSSETVMHVRIYVYSSDAIGKTFYPQLELGSTATGYEPYTGGAPCPSPDYQQEIQVARGRNLLELTRQVSGTDIAMSGGSVSVDDQTVTIVASVGNPYYGSVAAAGEQYAFSYGDIVKVKRNTKYVLTIHGASLNQLYVTKYDENKTSLGYTLVYNGVAFNTGSAEYVSFRFGNTGTTVGATLIFTAQLTEGSTPQPYVPYGHMGLEVRGAELYDSSSVTAGIYINGSGDTVSSQNWVVTDYLPVVEGQVKVDVVNTTNIVYHAFYDGTKTLISTVRTDKLQPFDIPNGARYMRASIHTNDAQSASIRIVSIDSTTPIPLPQRGWVGGLPDGTSDVLSIDSAGKVEWEKSTGEMNVNEFNTIRKHTSEETVFSSDSDSARVPLNEYTNPRIMCTHCISKPQASAISVGDATVWAKGYPGRVGIVVSGVIETAEALHQTYPKLRVLYPLAVPVTEECGYVDLPDIPASAQVSIPELEELGLTFWVDGDGTLRAAMREWYERAHSEYADRLTALEEAVAEIVAG